MVKENYPSLYMSCKTNQAEVFLIKNILETLEICYLYEKYQASPIKRKKWKSTSDYIQRIKYILYFAVIFFP